MPVASLHRPVDYPGPDKPALRGWIHTAMAPVMLLAGVAMLVWSPTPGLRGAVAIYALSAIVLFGCSAVYHRFYWDPGTTALLRRLDHSNIFLFIAGTYTPLAVALTSGSSRVLLLSIVWGVAVVGIAFRVFWLSAARWLYTLLYLALGWTAVGWMVPFWRNGGPGVVIMLVLGGVIYTLGAVVYARKRPDPSPRRFGYHEIFHAATAIAAICHYAAISLALATHL